MSAAFAEVSPDSRVLIHENQLGPRQSQTPSPRLHSTPRANSTRPHQKQFASALTDL